MRSRDSPEPDSSCRIGVGKPVLAKRGFTSAAPFVPSCPLKSVGARGVSFTHAACARKLSEVAPILRRISASVGPGRLVRVLLAPGVVGDTVPRGDR